MDKCLECDYCDQDEVSMEIHRIKVHVDLTAVLCHVCGLTVHDIGKHLELSHKEVFFQALLNKTDRSLYSKKFEDLECKFCSIRFNAKSMIQHLTKFHLTKFYKCETCQKDFKGLGVFNRHGHGEFKV